MPQQGLPPRTLVGWITTVQSLLNDKELAEFWRLFPHTFAQKLSAGKWKPYDYLKFISEEVARAISQGNGRILVSLPPRAGKSELISFWVPIWYLSLYPEKNVILSSYGGIFHGEC